VKQNPQPFTWFDEALIEKKHDEIVRGNRELQDHLLLTHRAFELLHAAIRNCPYEGDDDALVVLRLVARIFNTTGACLKLARAGYFQPAFTMVRDILEIEFLSDLFCRDRGQLRKWIDLDERSRNREFKQVTVRKLLDELDGFREQRRGEAYRLLSKHAAHVNPDGFHVISPDNMTQIGPFPSEDALVALFQELAKHLQWACIHLLKLLHSENPTILLAKDAFERALISWRRRYMPNAL
jgi:hypothetical protein